MTWLSKFFKFREHSDGDVVKPFLEHMEDLRWVVIKIVVTLLLSMGVSFLFVTDLMRLLKAPLHDVAPDLESKLVVREITESFMITVELAFFAGIVLALPFLIYFLASFILPALTRQEKKFLFPGIAGSTALFAAGVVVSYKYILPKTLTFFYEYSVKVGVAIMWSWKDYLSFASWLTIGLGLLCQLPIVVIVLSIVGLVDYPLLSRTRAYAISAILILSAIVAPTPDPVTLITLAAPVILLYEGCIWIVWLLDRRKKNRKDGDD